MLGLSEPYDSYGDRKESLGHSNVGRFEKNAHASNKFAGDARWKATTKCRAES